MSIIIVKFLLIIKIYLTILTILILVGAIFMWKLEKPLNEIKVEKWLKFISRTESYQIYTFKDIMEDFPKLLLITLNTLSGPIKILSFLVIATLCLIIKLFQFWMALLFSPILAVYILTKIYAKKEIIINFNSDRALYTEFDFIKIVFFWLPMAGCWRRIYIILKWYEQRPPMSREKLKVGAYNIIMPRILGLSFHNIYLIMRLLQIFFISIENLKGKRKLYYPVILYNCILNKICEELISYEHGYIRKAGGQRIYFIRGVMFFNMKLQNLFMMAHQKSGHFQSSSKLGSVKSINLKNSKGRDNDHATISIDEDGDQISTRAMLTSSPREESENISRGGKSYISINQIQNTQDLNEGNTTRVRMDELEIKMRTLEIKGARLENPDMCMYENNKKNYIVGKSYYEAVHENAIEKKDALMEKIAESRIKEAQLLASSTSIDDEYKMHLRFIENHPERLKLVSQEEMIKMGPKRIVEEINIRHEYLQDYPTCEPLKKEEEVKNDTQI